MNHARAKLALTILFAVPAAACGAGSPVAGAGADLPIGGGAGATGIDARPSIPAAPDVCAPFKLAYTPATGASAFDCPNVDCGCAAYSGPVLTPQHTCVASVDCAAACGDSQWLFCALGACATDAECEGGVGGRCVVVPGATQGVCQGGGRLCADAYDCLTGERCVAVAANGRRACVDPVANDRGPCNEDADCPLGHCALSPGSFLGFCSQGDLSALCFADRDCAPALRCRQAGGGQPGSCSDGGHGAPCDRDGDCRVGACVQGTCSDGRLDDLCDSNANCQSGFCFVRCTTGAVDAPCDADAQCATRRCAGNAAISACTTGATGARCLDDADCVSGACVHPSGQDPSWTFGTCR
jgi:hypothetical protein